LDVAQSMKDNDAGNTAKALTEADEALKSLDEIQVAMHTAEYGKWKNWYRGDWLTGVYRTQQTLEAYAAFLKDPLTHLSPPIVWSGWEAYYHIMMYEGDRSADVQ